MGNIRKPGAIRFSKLALIDLAFILFFSETAIRTIVSTTLGYIGLGVLRSLIMLCIHAVVAIILLLSAFLNKSKGKDGIFLIIIIAFVFLFSYLINPAVGTWFVDDEYGLLQKVFVMNGGVFAYLLVRLQISNERIFSNLKVCNIIWIVYLLYITLGRIRVGYWETTSVSGVMVHSAYHMSYGYYCAFIATLNFTLWKREKNAIYLPVAGLLFLTSIAFGSRGVILVYMIFVITQIWTSLQNTKSWKRIILIVFVIGFALLTFAFYSQILYLVQSMLGRIGIESRTLNSLIMGEFTEANGRDRIWQIVSEMIREKFPFGYGAFGDRPVVGQYYGWGYSHNVFLELIVSFGLIGAVISIWLIIESVKLINNTDIPEWNMLFVLFFVNSGQLLISNSFWYLSFFWAAIAIGVSYRQELKNHTD